MKNIRSKVGLIPKYRLYDAQCSRLDFASNTLLCTQYANSPPDPTAVATISHALGAAALGRLVAES